MENKNIILDIIIEFVKGIKNKDNAVEANVNNKLYKLWASSYLLNQILRQWNIPSNHSYVSVKAKNLWDKLSSKNIFDYHYTNMVICENKEPIKVKIYKGAENKYFETNLIYGNKFKFNSVFHEEHIIPISTIIENLCSLEELNYENVENVLNKISICKILKEEDKNLNKEHLKTNRPCDINFVLNNLYNKVGIEVIRADKISKWSQIDFIFLWIWWDL